MSICYVSIKILNKSRELPNRSQLIIDCLFDVDQYSKKKALKMKRMKEREKRKKDSEKGWRMNGRGRWMTATK